MARRFTWAAMVGLCVTSALGGAGGPNSPLADNDRQLKVVTSRATPTIESVTVYQTKDKKKQSVGELSKFDKTLTLPDEGPFVVFAKPKGGIPIKLADKLMVKAGQTHELKLGELIGTIEVFGDNFPRADKVVLTDERDPGPGEKGHVPVQVATDYRVDMAAPAGFYAVWVVPANGAKAQRVVDSVRIHAGKSVRVGD